MHNELYHHLSELCSPQPFINSRLHDATARKKITTRVCECAFEKVGKNNSRHMHLPFAQGRNIWSGGLGDKGGAETCVTQIKLRESVRVLPRILLMLELCMSGKAWRIFLLSSLAQTMKAFIGRLMCGSLLLRPRDSRNILESDTLGEPEGGEEEGRVGGTALEADRSQTD